MDPVEARSCGHWEGLISAVFSLAQSELSAGCPADFSPGTKEELLDARGRRGTS